MQINKKRPMQILFGFVVLTSGFAALAQDINPELLAATCVSCHGTRGASLGPATPVLAGMSRNYLVGAMLAYKYADDISAAEDITFEDATLEDVTVFGRQATIMTEIAATYSVEEIKAVAGFFEAQEVSRAQQEIDSELADTGRRIHNKYCEKCHEDGGSSAVDDVGLLAGQWRDYLGYTMEDFVAGDREMPKKMAEKMTAMQKTLGDSAIEQLVHFYGSKQ
jgi:sulfide dehydrogenase cytochrome subunit